MMMKIENGYVYLMADKTDEAEIRKWKLMNKDRRSGLWYGRTGITLLEKIKQYKGLTEPAKKELARLMRIQDAVNAERMRPDDELTPLAEYPVKAKLFSHQIRAANMCLMQFEMADPPEDKECTAQR